MKNLLFILVGSLLLLQCKKDLQPLPETWKGPQTYGWAQGKRNGTGWEASTICIVSKNDTTRISLSIATFDTDTLSWEDIGVVRIIAQEGTHRVYPLFAEEPTTGTYSLSEGDVNLSGWNIRDDKYSEVEIEHLDWATKKIKGRLNLYFSGGDKEYIKQVEFKDLRFEADIIEK